MPNWCNNSIVLKHKDLAMLERAARAFNDDRFLGEFVPVPGDLIETTAGAMGDPAKQAALELREQANVEKHGYKNWYDFCLSEWGTKWDVGCNGTEVAVDADGALRLNFESAWGPPVEAYRKLDEMGFEILAYYFEPGMGFCGEYTTEFDDQSYQIEDSTYDWVKNNIPEDIDTAMGISDCMGEWEETVDE